MNPYLPRDIPPRAHWRDRALCNQPGADPDLWYPTEGGTVPMEAAIRVCRTCPVVAECLTWAMDNDEVHWGVLGGMTPEQRKALRKQGAA